MALLLETALTSEGIAPFDVAASVTNIVYLIDETPNVQLRSSIYPYRIMHAGWIALAYVAGGPLGFTGSQIRWHKYFEFGAENLDLSPAVFADGILYCLPAGGSGYLWVYG